MIKIDSPFHGAVLNHRHGRQQDDSLTVEVRGRAPREAPVTVNGIPAQRAGDAFHAEVALRDAETEIVATGQGSRGICEHRVRVVWDRHSCPRYRFGIDDNSFFLRDIAQRRCSSIFDSFYLDMLRGLHARYGTKIVLNLYFSTDDGFDLTQFPERYRGEWQDCSDWLKLTFHAYADKPDRPYQYAPPEKLAADFDAVVEQIHRFAGTASYAPPTIVHWGMVPRGACSVLQERGVTALCGYFVWDADLARHDVNYWLDAERSDHLSRHDALKDFDSGIVFSRVDLVCNVTPAAETVAELERLRANPDTAEIMDLMTHEQYFFDFYENYTPDHAERLDVALRWVTENGYEPVFFHEGLLGGRAPDG